MPSLYANIEINAPRAIVWQTLVRKQDWVRWNTFLYDLSPNQPFRQGDRVLLSMKRTSSEAETEIQPRILLLQPDVCMHWVYTAPGLTCEHVFDLQDIGQNRTRYTHRETMSGLLVRMILPFIRQDEQEGLRRMALELKRYVERR